VGFLRLVALGRHNQDFASKPVSNLAHALTRMPLAKVPPFVPYKEGITCACHDEITSLVRRIQTRIDAYGLPQVHLT